jgi:long-chain acyl-CoA synthetase
MIPGIDMKILSPDDSGAGEVAVKGPVVMQGYLDRPEDTAAAFTDDGYFKTGDVGRLDSEKYLYLTGRAKNMIVTEGGKNVYPEEVEDAFQLYDDIEQILVRGFVRDKKKKAEGIEALIYPNATVFAGKSRDDTRRAIDAIVATVNKRLRPYQRIEKITLLDAPLEMTTTKKIKRH